VLIGDIVAAQPRKPSANIPDKVPASTWTPTWWRGCRHLEHPYAYDIDGTASANIAAIADPQLTAAAQRPARFLRVEKAVAIPDDKLVDLNNTAFGPDRSQGMREIVAYAPIEPDGSVRCEGSGERPACGQHPRCERAADYAAAPQLDSGGPGQELKCNGCHASTTNFSHGRSDTFAAAYAGAAGTGVPFPNTRPHSRRTSARRWRRRALASENQIADKDLLTQLICPPKRSIDPSVNLLYCDAWTTPRCVHRTRRSAYD
jgi:hypothetical protein